MSHLGVHPRFRHHGYSAAIDNGAAHVRHVAPVAQRHGTVGDDLIRLFHNGYGFSGERRFVKLERGALDDPDVRGDRVARLQMDDVSGDKILALNVDEFAVTHHLGGGGGHLLQSFDGLLSFALLDHAENRVQHHDKEDDEHVQHGLAGVSGGDARQDRGNEEDDYHGVEKLFEEAFHDAVVLSFRELVFAVFVEPSLRLPGVQSLHTGFQFLHDVVDGRKVVLHNFVLSCFFLKKDSHTEIRLLYVSLVF